MRIDWSLAPLVCCFLTLNVIAPIAVVYWYYRRLQARSQASDGPEHK